jgi:hypothetical protein
LFIPVKGKQKVRSSQIEANAMRGRSNKPRTIPCVLGSILCNTPAMFNA